MLMLLNLIGSTNLSFKSLCHAILVITCTPIRPLDSTNDLQLKGDIRPQPRPLLQRTLLTPIHRNMEQQLTCDVRTLELELFGAHTHSGLDLPVNLFRSSQAS